MHVLQGKKGRDLYIKVYNVRETILSDQTVQFTVRSQQGIKYIMVMVNINSNSILFEPLKSRKDEKLTIAYQQLMTRLHQAGITPRKHVLDNKASSAI